LNVAGKWLRIFQHIIFFPI